MTTEAPLSSLSERTASLAGAPLPGSKLAALKTEITRPGASLRFADATLEADYLADRASGCAAQARGGLLLSAILTAVFLCVDSFLLGMHYPVDVLRLMTFGLAPLFVVAWVAMRIGRCKPWIVHINIAAMIVAGFVFAWVIHTVVITSDRPPYSFEALLLYVAVLYFLSGAMFHAAIKLALGMSLLFIFCIAGSTVNLAVVGYCSYFLVTTNLIFAIGRYMLDKTYRRNFLTRMIAVELAERDPLTGVSNRRAFEDRLQTLLRESSREGKSLTVLMLDIDHFKQINDTGGHALGDDALRLLADALRDIARRPLDSVARLGGDEFAVLWLGLPHAEVPERAADLTARFAERISSLGERLGKPPTLSIGIAHALNARGYDAESLLHCADVALYRAKDLGRDQVQIETLPAL